MSAVFNLPRVALRSTRLTGAVRPLSTSSALLNKPKGHAHDHDKIPHLNEVPTGSEAAVHADKAADPLPASQKRGGSVLDSVKQGAESVVQGAKDLGQKVKEQLPK